MGNLDFSASGFAVFFFDSFIKHKHASVDESNQNVVP